MKVNRYEKADTAQKRQEKFFQTVKYGPIFICICCHRKLFETGVKEIKDMRVFIEELDMIRECLFDDVIGSESLRSDFFVMNSYFVCLTCDKYIKRGKLPPMSNQNKLSVFDEHHPKYMKKYEYLRKMSEMESCMIAKNLLFMKVFPLPKSRISAFKDRIINVPITSEDVIDTIKSLPRTPREAEIVCVKLKRKKEYKNTHLQEYVNVRNLKQSLVDLKYLGHPEYQDIDLAGIDQFEERCALTDPDLVEDLFNDQLNTSETSAEIEYEKDDILEDLDQPPTDKSPEIDIEDEIENEFQDYLTNDVIRKFQFDYNRSTCMANNAPEISAADVNEIVSIAPGEGKVPKSLLLDPKWDSKSHANLDPTAENSLNSERKTKISNQQFFEQRIMNADSRFADSKSYVFAAVQYTESKQLNDKVNISFNRGHKQTNEAGGISYSLNDPWAVFDNIKNTPRYWKKKRDELISKLENFGPFQFFFTLSCADMRWEENFTSLLTDYTIIYKRVNGRERAYIIDDDVEVSLDDFLKKHVSKHEFLRKNVLNATRNFNHRVKSFMRNIVMSKHNPMCVEYYNYRCEFQLRGGEQSNEHFLVYIHMCAF